MAFTNPDWPRRTAFYDALIGEGDTTAFKGFLCYVDESGLDRETLAFQQQAQPSTAPAELATIKVPVLVISGNADQDNSSAEALAALIPGSSVKRTPGVHNTAHQSPKLAREVLKFLQQNRAD